MEKFPIDNVLYVCPTCGKVWDGEVEDWVELSNEMKETVTLLRIELRGRSCQICDPSQILSCS